MTLPSVSEVIEFNKIRELYIRFLLSTGSVHGDDYFLIFENVFREPVRPDERVISKNFIHMLEGFAQHGTAIYADCVFPNNVNQKQFQLVAIKRDKCENLQVDRYPEIVNNFSVKVEL